MSEIKIKELVQILKAKSKTVGFAESCTGGLLSAMMTQEPGVSAVFKGSIISYANSVKEDLLGVSSVSLQKEGAVSELVARQMAQGLRKALKVDWAVAITGIAGPSGGTLQKPVGTVCFCFSGPDLEESLVKHFKGDREEIQKASVNFAAERLLALLEVSLK